MLDGKPVMSDSAWALYECQVTTVSYSLCAGMGAFLVAAGSPAPQSHTHTHTVSNRSYYNIAYVY